ncbi:hypothetical protein WDV85_12095 [Pseudokineococcus sp. 5B2Z-1]|uniref:hypothetical protein n=1 Tax=Pseudokineococcus sp. 5B2Z-1 TaxID=3132744 RepID=UPI0030AFF66E
MEQWRTLLTVEVGPRTCRVGVVEQQHPAYAFAAATGRPVPTGDYGYVVTGTHEPPQRTHTVLARTTTTPAPMTTDDLRGLVELVLAAPGRQDEDAEVAAVVVIRRRCPGVDVDHLVTGVLPEVPVLDVEALDVLARGALVGDALVTLDAGTTDDGEPLVCSALYDDLARQLTAPRTDRLHELAALVRADTHLGCPDSSGITCLLGDAARPLSARLRGTPITDGPRAGDQITSDHPTHPDPAEAVGMVAPRHAWPR